MRMGRCRARLVSVKRQQAAQDRVARLGVQLLIGNRAHQGFVGLARGFGRVLARANGGDVAGPVLVQARQKLRRLLVGAGRQVGGDGLGLGIGGLGIGGLGGHGRSRRRRCNGSRSCVAVHVVQMSFQIER